MQAFRYTEGYHAQSGLRPGNLTLALLLSGGLVSSMFFLNPRVVRIVDPPFIGTNIPLAPPPPLDKPPPPTPHPKAPPPTDIYVAPIPQPPIATHDTPDIDVTTTPPPPYAGLPGDGTAPAKAEPARPAVLTAASLDDRYAANFQPAYPPDEIRAGREGHVTVRVLIGIDGHVRQVERVSAASDSFFEATRRRALEKWRFRPATRDGVPYESWKTVGVSFVLDAQ